MYSAMFCSCQFLFILTCLISLNTVLKSFSEALFYFFLFIIGFFIWTFFEYMFHRYWMHDAKNKNRKKDFNHVHHHSHPTDIRISNLQRSLLGLVAIAVFIFSMYLQNYFILIAGFLCGFPVYTIMHFLLHQKSTQKIFKRLIEYHIYHHCKSPERCFGVSATWWDDIFRTTPKKTDPITQRIIDFYFEKEHN